MYKPSSGSDSRHSLLPPPTVSWSLALVLITALPFAGVLIQEYGYFDDYSLKVRIVSGEWSLTGSEFFLDGRPLFGVLVQTLFGGPTSVSALWIPRAFGLAAIVLFSLTLFHHSKSLGLSPLLAGAWALLGTLQPGWAVFGFWGTAAPIAWSFLFGYWAGVCLTAVHRRPVAGTTGVVLFGILSLAIYQLGVGMIAIAYLLPRFISPEQTIRNPVRESATPSLVVGAFFGVYLIAHRICTALGVIGPGRQERAEFGEHLGRSFNHLTGFLLPTALQGWSKIFPSPYAWVLAALMIIPAVVAVVFFIRSNWRRHGWIILGWSAVLALMCVPLLPPGAVWAHYRVLPSISLAFLLPLLGWIHLAKRPASRKVLATALGTFAMLCVIATTYAVSFQRVPQLAAEWQSLKDEVAASAPQPHLLTTVIAPHGPFPTTPFWQLPGEFRLRSTPTDWVLRSMILLAWAEREKSPHLNAKAVSDFRIDLVQPGYSDQRLVMPPVIHLDRDAKIPPELTDPPAGPIVEIDGLGSLVKLDSDYYYSPSFGSVKDAGGNWYHLSNLGWIYRPQASDQGFSAWSKRLGWIRWNEQDGRFVFTENGEEPPRDFSQSLFSPAPKG